MQVCEIDADDGDANNQQPATVGVAPVATSPFFIPKVSDNGFPAQDGSDAVFRVLGVTATGDSRFEHQGNSHLLTWFEAQSVRLH